MLIVTIFSVAIGFLSLLMPLHTAFAQPILQLGATYNVNATNLKCRATPSPSATVLSLLPNATSVRVIERRNHWWQISYKTVPLCWVKSEFLTATELETRINRLYHNGDSANKEAISTSPSSRPQSTASSRQKKAARIRRMDKGVGSGCPCSGRQVCIGPRGGRYCITSDGSKQYGI